MTTADVNGDNKTDLIIANGNANNIAVLFQSGESRFDAKAVYFTGSNSWPASVTTSDVNEDEKVDIIVANRDGNNVGVLLNIGTGMFHGQETYSTGSDSGPVCVTTGDVNGDNKVDIIVANRDGNNVGVLVNSGRGTFDDQVRYSTGALSLPSCVTTVDVNEDNKVDIIVANIGQDNIGIFVNSGTGTFNRQVTYSTGALSYPTSVTAVDINGDNKVDIVVARFGHDNVGVLVNKGEGRFNAEATYSTGSKSGPSSVTTADVNGDNKVDIIVANYFRNNVGILLNDGTGTFHLQATYSNSSGSHRISVTTGDVDGDNKLDIIVANLGEEGNNVRVFWNNRTGRFDGEVMYSTGPRSEPGFVTAGDVNGDNKVDIIVANLIGKNVYVFFNSGKGTFYGSAIYFTSGSAESLATADVNGDNKVDIVVAEGTNVSVLLNTGTGTFNREFTLFINAFGHVSVTTGDVNGDNKVDIIVANSGANNVYVLLNTGTGTFNNPAMYSTGSNSMLRCVTTADVNGDNKVDIIVANTGDPRSTGNVSVFVNTGKGTFHGQVTYSTGYGSMPRCVTTGDVNGDNKVDIIVALFEHHNVGVFVNTGTGMFNDQVTYSTGSGSHPEFVTTGDVNGDNKVDIIVANRDGNNVGVLVNSGTGTFNGQVTYSTGVNSRPISVTTGDVNGDNKVDIIVANSGGNNVGVLLNSVTAMCNAGETASDHGNFEPTSVTTADVNGDNKVDIIVANSGGNNVAVLLNSGTGTFNGQVTYSTGYNSGPRSVTTSDVNGDNKVDIIVANYFGNNVGVLLNNGTGTFNDQMTYSSGSTSGPRSVTTADVNGDNKVDIILANEEDRIRGDDSVSVLLNSGTGTFNDQVTYFTGYVGESSSVTTADVNGDNEVDFIVAKKGDRLWRGDCVSVLLNSGRGTFNVEVRYSTGDGSSPVCVTTGDVNGDNKVDIIVANGDAWNVGVFLNNGTGTFNGQVTYSTGYNSGPRSVTTADVNGDNKVDIIVANFGHDNVGVFVNTGTGTFNDQVTYSTGSVSYPYSVTTADVNGDNRPDIIVAKFGHDNIGVFVNSGTGTFNGQVTYSTGSGSGPRSLTTGDVNGDNKLDIIVANSETSNVGVFVNDGTGTFNDQVTYSTGFKSMPICVTTGDVNGDNKVDIIVANRDENNVGVLLNSGTGIFNNNVMYSTGGSSFPVSVTTADVNGDNKVDIIVANSVQGDIRVLLNSGTGGFGLGGTYLSGYSGGPVSVTTADVNGDNKADIIVGKETGSKVVVLVNSGTGTFYGEVRYLTGSGSHRVSVTTGDVNGDNKVDIIVAKLGVEGNSVGVFLNNGTGTFNGEVRYLTGSGSYPKFVTTGDVNGDNKVDIIVANGEGNNVGVLLNNGTGWFQDQVKYSTGALSFPECVTTADVNGDNKVDIIVGNNGGNVRVFVNTGVGTFYDGVFYSIVSGGCVW